MIEQMNLISEEDGYKRFNKFEIADELKDILRDDYYLYNTIDFKYKKEAQDLYDKNFVNKYNRETHAQIFEQYIDNDAFKDKAKFVYSLIDEEKYKKFAQENSEIENPNDITIKYTISDSSGVNVVMYHLGIVDISFVF